MPSLAPIQALVAVRRFKEEPDKALPCRAGNLLNSRNLFS
jgi:hypothetical protein